MRETKQLQVPIDSTTIISCDRCEKKADLNDMMDYQEWLSLNISCGYAAILGDGNEYELDLCQDCTKEVLGPFLRLKHNYITHEDYNNNEKPSTDRTTREA